MSETKNNFESLKNFSKKTGMFLQGRNIYLKKNIKTKLFNTGKNKKENKIQNVLDNIPKGATHVNGNYFYKQGSHNFFFIFINKDWKRCEEEEFKKARRI